MNTQTIPQHSGNGHMPANNLIQEDLVLTPGGYKPRSKVHLLETINQDICPDGQTQPTNNTMGQPLQTFASGQAPPRPTALPGSAWVAYTEFENLTPSALNLFTADWTVPDPPKAQDNQTIFIFIGLQNNKYILQPVLQWGPSHAGGGKYWSISVWYTDGITKDTYCKQAVRVAQRTKLRASMELINQVDRSFTYKVSFSDFPGLDHVQKGVKELFWAFVVLESYNIDNNNQYPATPQTQVEVVKISTTTSSLSPIWRPVIQQRTGIHPSGEIDPSAPNKINLKYR